MNTAVTDAEICSGELVWEIRVWSALPRAAGEPAESAVFESADQKWSIAIYPGGYDDASSGSVAFFMRYKGSHRCVECQSMEVFAFDHAEGVFHIVRKCIGDKFGIQTLRDEGIGRARGWTEFMERDLFERKFVSRDHVRFKVCIKVRTAVYSTVWQAAAWAPPTTIARDMVAMWEGRDMTGDGTVIVGGERFRVHKCIVAHRSPRLHASFFGGGSEMTLSEVAVDDFTPDAVRELLRCVYTDKCDADALAAMPESLLEVGDAFGVDRMIYLCEHFLVRTLALDNAAARLQLADKHVVAADLREAAIEFIHRHFEEVEKTDGWTHLVEAPRSGRLVADVLRPKRPREPFDELCKKAEGVKRMRVGEMRAELQRRGLESFGLRAELERRLEAMIGSAAEVIEVSV